MTPKMIRAIAQAVVVWLTLSVVWYFASASSATAVAAIICAAQLVAIREALDTLAKELMEEEEEQ